MCSFDTSSLPLPARQRSRRRALDRARRRPAAVRDRAALVVDGPRGGARGRRGLRQARRRRARVPTSAAAASGTSSAVGATAPIATRAAVHTPVRVERHADRRADAPRCPSRSAESAAGTRRPCAAAAAAARPRPATRRGRAPFARAPAQNCSTGTLALAARAGDDGTRARLTISAQVRVGRRRRVAQVAADACRAPESASTRSGARPRPAPATTP